MDESNELIQQRVRKLEVLRKEGVDPFPNDFRATHTTSEIHETYGSKSEEELKSVSEHFSLAGRVMAIRDFGKASFVQIQDGKGRIQANIQKNAVGDQAFKHFKTFDIGDLIGLEGKVFRTKTGELTLLVDALKLLVKSLRPLPEKWHGLTDIEARYRQRYLDLIANPRVKEVFLTRTRAIQKIRDFFTRMGFVEVETPMLHPIPGGATAKPFKTHHNALDMDLYMRVAPELFLKRLVIGGLERIFEINRCFRNEGISTLHNPEFTMLEFYQAYATYEDMMAMTEELLCSMVQEIHGKLSLTYQEKEIEFVSKDCGEIPKGGCLSGRNGIDEWNLSCGFCLGPHAFRLHHHSRNADIQPGSCHTGCHRSILCWNHTSHSGYYSTYGGGRSSHSFSFSGSTNCVAAYKKISAQG